MRTPTTSKILRFFFLTLVFLLCTSACGLRTTSKPYLLKEFLQESFKNLSLQKQNVDGLKEWGVYWRSEEEDYPFNVQRLSELLMEMSHQTTNNSYEECIRAKWIKPSDKPQKMVDRELALFSLQRCIHTLNRLAKQSVRPEIRKLSAEEFYDQAYKEGEYIAFQQQIYHIENQQAVRVAAEEWWKKINYSQQNDIDLSTADYHFYGEEVQSGYVNRRFHLLATASGEKTFLNQGYKISYQMKASALTIHLSKTLANGNNFYVDFSLSNLQPNFLWKTKDGKIEQAKFILDFRSSQKIGLSRSHRQDRNIYMKEISKEEFLASLPVKEKNNASSSPLKILPLCQIDFPLTGLPFTNFRVELAAHFYVGGKVEIALHQHPRIGFEIYQNQVRYIHEAEGGITPYMQASANARLNLDASIVSLQQKLANLYLTSGIEASFRSRLLFQDSKEKIVRDSEIEYDSLVENYNKYPNVHVCGESTLKGRVSLGINSEQTLLGRFGFTHELTLFDKELPLPGGSIFNNGLQVKQCQFPQYNTPKVTTDVALEADRLSIERYSIFLQTTEKKALPTIQLPSSYTKNDLRIVSEDETVVKIADNYLYAQKAGNTRLHIYTSDLKHSIYCHVLVSLKHGS